MAPKRKGKSGAMGEIAPLSGSLCQICQERGVGEIVKKLGAATSHVSSRVESSRPRNLILPQISLLRNFLISTFCHVPSQGVKAALPVAADLARSFLALFPISLFFGTHFQLKGRHSVTLALGIGGCQKSSGFG